jgi:PAS domain S-box-containing protein
MHQRGNFVARKVSKKAAAAISPVIAEMAVAPSPGNEVGSILEQSFLAIFERSPIGIGIAGSDQRYRMVNPAFCRMLGYSEAELLSKSYIDITHPDDVRPNVGKIEGLKAGEGSHFSMEKRYVRKDGEIVWVLLNVVTGNADGGKDPYTIGLAEDITERKRTEQALARSEEAFRRLAQISPAAIFRADMDGKCTYANQRCAEAAGRPLEELLGDGWLRVMHPEDRERVMTQWRLDMNARQPKPLEWRVLRPDGTVRWVLSEAAAELDERGRPIGYISCLSDITELKEREERRRAELADQRDTLVREVHHRIKNNLQSVAGLLQRELGRFAELDPRLEAAISQVHAIAAVHGLQSTRPDETVRLCDSVRSICKTAADLSQRPVRFDIECEQTTFRPVGIEHGEAVPVALVLNELILNAIKHSPPGGVGPTVSLSADGGRASIVIRNEVKGRPEFDIDTGRGLGIGLRLVRSLLPNTGAHLAYEPDREHAMLVRLTLEAPVITRWNPLPQDTA